MKKIVIRINGKHVNYEHTNSTKLISLQQWQLCLKKGIIHTAKVEQGYYNKQRKFSLNFFFAIFFGTLSSNFCLAQSITSDRKNSQVDEKSICATLEPDEEWEIEFAEKIKQYKENLLNRKTAVTYTVPVIVHILHSGVPVGTGENISAKQVASQMLVLNNDFAGNLTGTPAVFNSVNAGNIGIEFCLALKDQKGNLLPEPGIDRIDWYSKGWDDPGSINNISSLQPYFNNVVKPATIWDPVKYINIWVVDLNGLNLTGFAFFPAGVSNNFGASASTIETVNNSGIVMNYKAFGTIEAATFPYYDLGHITSHEMGHFLGLRHMWGDSNCGTDYCNDTPPAKQANNGCNSHPYNIGVCSGNTTGEMFMNHMDYSYDKCKSLFTKEQAIRMQTVMATGTYRKFLGTHGLCTSNSVGIQTSCCENSSNTFHVYPIPASEFIEFNVNNISNASYSILNGLGQQVLVGKIADSKKIDISSLRQGIYFICITYEGSYNLAKFLVE